MNIQPFEVNIPQDDLDDLGERLIRARRRAMALSPLPMTPDAEKACHPVDDAFTGNCSGSSLRLVQVQPSGARLCLNRRDMRVSYSAVRGALVERTWGARNV
jgi:hypothetical protein